MKSLVAALVAATLVCSATPTGAYIAHVSTSVAVADANDELAVKQALQTAVDDLLSQGIGFTPTLVVLTRAILLDGRLYIRLLVADDEGARLFRDGGGDDLVAASGI
jgi:Na+-translocating ferredoxin:NAD+ oxidoreductase RnfE subunit